MGLWNGISYNDVKEPYYFMSERTDLYHVAENRLSFLDWYRDYKKVNSFLRYNKKDLAPTSGSIFSVRLILSVIKRYFYAIIKKDYK